MAIEEVVTRYRQTRRWRGRRMTVCYWKLGYFITIPAQKYVYLSQLHDPLDFAGMVPAARHP